MIRFRNFDSTLARGAPVDHCEGAQYDRGNQGRRAETGDEPF